MTASRSPKLVILRKTVLRHLSNAFVSKQVRDRYFDRCPPPPSQAFSLTFVPVLVSIVFYHLQSKMPKTICKLAFVNLVIQKHEQSRMRRRAKVPDIHNKWANDKYTLGLRVCPVHAELHEIRHGQPSQQSIDV